MGYSSTQSTPDFYVTASCGCFSSDWITLTVYQVQSLRHDGVKVFIISSGTRDKKKEDLGTPN